MSEHKPTKLKRGANLIGERYERLLIIAAAEPNANYGRRWLCRCDCGTERVFEQSNLRGGYTKSCGCLKREQTIAGKYSRTHGMTGTPEHGIWSGMIQRCTNQNMDSWHDYGARGISVCSRWRSFEAFYADMGPRPSREFTLDRIDVNGNYEPGNVKWSTRAEQAQRRRTTTLNWDLVNEMRGRHEHGESIRSIARRMNLRMSRVGDVVRQRIWRDAT